LIFKVKEKQTKNNYYQGITKQPSGAILVIPYFFLLLFVCFLLLVCYLFTIFVAATIKSNKKR